MKFCLPGMLLIFALCAGCGPTPPVRLACVPTHGELYVGGQPASGAELLFQPADVSSSRWQAGMPHAVVREDGSFTVETYETKAGVADGAPEGEYVVLVKWMTQPTVPAGERPRDDHAPYDRLLGKHYNPVTATLRAKVSAPETRLPRFQL